MPDKMYLRQMQMLPLIAKVHMSQNRIKDWYDHFDGHVFVSFSGGKDSTVLAHLVHEYYPDVPLVFCNTGLEYPEVQEFARKMGAEFVCPKMKFSEVISTYGYPIISKENAEAIHYARKIRNALETARRRADHSGKRFEYEKKTAFKSIDNKRNEMNGTRVFTKAGQDGEGQRLKESRSHVISLTRTIGEEDTLTGGVVDLTAETSSIFNRTKWLPLCKDTQFKISHMCCQAMKKSPLGKYQREHKVYPILGTLAEESRLREQAWVKHGCNAFEGKKKTSQPLSFWTEQDILKYLYVEGYEIASVYGDIVGVDKDGYEYEPFPGADCTLKCTGCTRTGCVFCGFGVHLEKGETRFQRLAKTHPKQYEYCMNGGQWVDNPDYDPAAPKMDGDWENWNPKKIWVPSKQGLGMKHVFDEVNAIYGKDFIRYD